MRMKARFVDKNGKHFRGLFAVNTFGGCRLNLDDLMHIFGVRQLSSLTVHLFYAASVTRSHKNIFPFSMAKGFPSTIYNSSLRIQSPSRMMIGVYNHLLNERYLGIKGIGSLGISWPHGPWNPWNQGHRS